MFGLPTETLKEAFETMELNAKIKSNISTPTILQPIIGTTIYKFIQDNDLFVSDFNPDHMSGHYGKSPLKIKDKRAIDNLQKLAWIGIKFPFTIPLVKKLVKLPPNPIFNILFKVSLLYKYVDSRNLSWLEMIKIGWTLRKNV